VDLFVATSQSCTLRIIDQASGGLVVFEGSGGVGNLASRLDEGCDANFLRVERVIGRRRCDEVTKTR